MKIYFAQAASVLIQIDQNDLFEYKLMPFGRNRS